MRYTRFVSALLAVLLVAALCMTGCSAKEQEATTPETTAPTAPNTPADPTEPPELTAHQKLVAYLKEKGTVTAEESTYTFTMGVEEDQILWTYSNAGTNITVTLTDGAAMHAVAIKFNVYDATAEVEAATFSSANPQLSNFHCWVAAMAEPLQKLATTAVAACFSQAAKAMQPSGVNLVELGFTGYYS